MAALGKSCNTAKNENCPPGSVPPSSMQPNSDSNKMPNVLLCFKVPKPLKTDKTDTETGDKKKKKKRSKSCELRSSILYKGCACESRNGLQDDCQRSECRGSPECLTNPPTCGPSEFAGGKAQTKKFEEFIKIKKEIENQRLDIANGITAQSKLAAEKKKNMFEYDCIPVDSLQEGGTCPLCQKEMNTSGKPKPPANANFKSISIPEDCICCSKGC